MRPKLLVPSEAEEQAAVIEWADAMAGRFPELKLLYATNNELHRATLGRARQQGVKSGVPDLHLPIARGRYHGLWLEMKRRKRPQPLSDAQRAWIEALELAGHRVEVCRGADDAVTALYDYLAGNQRDAAA